MNRRQFFRSLVGIAVAPVAFVALAFRPVKADPPLLVSRSLYAKAVGAYDPDLAKVLFWRANQHPERWVDKRRYAYVAGKHRVIRSLSFDAN